jgi:hypothetical protein
MHKKGSMELSVNSIVILVIAVVMMGLILGFIRSQFVKFQGDFLVDEEAALDATPTDPITLSRYTVTVSGVKKTGLNVNFYNSGADPVNGAIPRFYCNSNSPIIIGEYFPKDATTSAMASFTGNIKINTAVVKDTYLCKVCFTRNNVNQCGTADQVAEKEFQIVVQ